MAFLSAINVYKKMYLQLFFDCLARGISDAETDFSLDSTRICLLWLFLFYLEFTKATPFTKSVNRQYENITNDYKKMLSLHILLNL